MFRFILVIFILIPVTLYLTIKMIYNFAYTADTDALVLYAMGLSFMLIIDFFAGLSLLTKSRMFKFLVVNNETKSGAGVKMSGFDHLEGLKGEASTDLRLSGKVRIDNREYPAVSKDEFIDKGEEVEVCKVEGNKIIVIKSNN